MAKLDDKIEYSVAKSTFESVDIKKEQFEMIQKINKIYHETLQKYMNTKVVVEFNFLEFLKSQTVGITTQEEFKSLMLTIIDTMKSKENRSQVENYELSLARKIYRDVALGKGEKFEYNDIEVDYDGQTVVFDPFSMKDDILVN